MVSGSHLRSVKLFNCSKHREKIAPHKVVKNLYWINLTTTNNNKSSPFHGTTRHVVLQLSAQHGLGVDQHLIPRAKSKFF